MYIPNFLRVFPGYRNPDNHSIIQFSQSAPLHNCFLDAYLQVLPSRHPSNLLSPPYRDQKQANDLKTILGDSSALINWTGPVCKIIHFPTCVHATKGWLASPGNQQTPIHSAVSWKRAGSKITCGCSRR